MINQSHVIIISAYRSKNSPAQLVWREESTQNIFLSSDSPSPRIDHVTWPEMVFPITNLLGVRVGPNEGKSNWFVDKSSSNGTGAMDLCCMVSHDMIRAFFLSGFSSFCVS